MLQFRLTSTQTPVPTSSAIGPAATRALPLLTATIWRGEVEDAVRLVNTIETVEYAEWIREIGHLAPFAVWTAPRPWEFNKRAQPVSIVRCAGGSIFRVIADAKTLENQLKKTLWCGWYTRGTRIRGVFVSARKLHSEVGPL